MAHKFRKGAEIVDINTLIQILTDNGWVYYHLKPLHPSFVLNMTLRTVISGIKTANFHQAEQSTTQ